MRVLWFGRRRRVGDAKLTDEQREQVLELADEGLTSRDIADELGVSASTVQRVLRQARQKKPATAKQVLEDFKARALVKAIESRPELEDRLAEGAIDDLVGAQREKPLTTHQLDEAQRAFESRGLKLMHQSEIDGWRKREESLERRLERKEDKIAELSEKLARYGGDDDEPSLMDKLGLAPEAQVQVVNNAVGLLTGGFRSFFPGAAPPALGDGQVQAGAALPLPSGLSPGAFLAAYVALPADQAAQHIVGKAHEGVAFDRVPLGNLLCLLAADPRQPQQLVDALCALPDGAVLRSALERGDWRSWLVGFVAAVVQWPPEEAATAEHSDAATITVNAQPPAAAVTEAVTPEQVLEKLEQLGPAEIVTWALSIPEMAERLGQLSQLDDRQIPTMLRIAATAGDAESRPVAQWLLENASKRRAIVVELRARMTAAMTSEAAELPPEDDAGA